MLLSGRHPSHPPRARAPSARGIQLGNLGARIDGGDHLAARDQIFTTAATMCVAPSVGHPEVMENDFGSPLLHPLLAGRSSPTGFETSYDVTPDDQVEALVEAAR